MSASDYIRCHYIGENDIQCESWFPRLNGAQMCAVHVNCVSTKLAANGVNKAEYIDARRVAEKDLRGRLEGLDTQAQCNLLDEHIQGIEQIIEEQRTLYATAKAIRTQVYEGMDESERQIRRSIKVARPEPTIKRSSGKIAGTNEEKIAKLRAKHPNMTEAAAKMLLGLDD